MEFNSRAHLTYLKSVIDSLLMQVTGIPDEKGTGMIRFQIFKKCRVSEDEYGEWYVEIDAHDDALPLLFGFRSHYFKYELWNALRLKSRNQLWMYETLKQYEKIGSKVFSVGELKRLLGIGEDDYPLFKNFRQDVLEVCKKALSENTDISFTYEPHGKKGRGGKINELKFTITKNKDFKDPLSLEKFIDIDKEIFEEDEENNDINDNNADGININLTYIDENTNIKSTGTHPLYEEHITYLMTACNGEFSRDEMVVLYNEMREAVPHLCHGKLDAHDYMQKKYNEMQMRNPDRSRFGYLRTMIVGDKS